VRCGALSADRPQPILPPIVSQDDTAASAAGAGPGSPAAGQPRDGRILGGTDYDYDHPLVSAWGLQPAQWQPVGGRVPYSQRAVLLWRTDGESEPALRARRAYDTIFPTGTPCSADSTPRGIEIVVPLAVAGRTLRRLAGPGNLPDAVIVDPAAHVALLRALRQEVRRLRGGEELLLDRGAAAGGASTAVRSPAR
jgi:hypothetical protein